MDDLMSIIGTKVIALIAQFAAVDVSFDESDSDSIAEMLSAVVQAQTQENTTDENVTVASDLADGEYTVTHIVDGDTFDINTGERVRMIGMNTPERGETYYSEATQELTSLIDGKTVTLTKDVSETDRYGRLLRHVYIGDMWINKEMVVRGYARFVTFPPDVAHVDEFTQAEKEAREAKRGLWSVEE